MGFLFGNKKRGKLALVFDIGSSSVGAAFFWVGESGVPRVVYTTRESIVMEKTFDVTRFMALTTKALDVVAEKAHKAGVGAPSKIFCILSSSLHISQTRVVKLEKNADFTFTTKLADDLIQKEIKIFKDEHMDKYEDTPYALRLVELKNIKVILNGYETSKPLEKKAKRLEMTLFMSMGPEQVLSKIESVISKYFHFKEIKFSSFLMAFFSVVRDIYPHQEEFLLIDINGEITDVSMTKKSILRESASFPIGCNSIIRGVAVVLRSSLDEARSALALVKDGHMAESSNPKLNAVVEKLKQEWLDKFQESLANLSNDISIPSTIYISVEKDLAEFFSDVIRSEQFNQYILTESKFDVIFLGTDVFYEMTLFNDNIVRDTNLVISAIYINRFFY